MYYLSKLLHHPNNRGTRKILNHGCSRWVANCLWKCRAAIREIFRFYKHVNQSTNSNRRTELNENLAIHCVVSLFFFNYLSSEKLYDCDRWLRTWKLLYSFWVPVGFSFMCSWVLIVREWRDCFAFLIGGIEGATVDGGWERMIVGTYSILVELSTLDSPRKFHQQRS